MNKKMMTVGLVLALAVTVHAQQTASASTADREQAQQILKETGVTGGLVVHLGCGDGKLTAALRASDSFVVQGLDADVTKARENIRAAGVYGPVSAVGFSGGKLPYADSLVRLLVLSKDTGVKREEMERVLCPGGVLVWLDAQSAIRKTAWTKPRPKEMDDWTHFLHGPDNNAVANDTLVGPPRQVQWRGGIDWVRDHGGTPSISSLVEDAGRVFAIIDYGPTVSRGLPEDWRLVARDAFSGVELWRVPISKKWVKSMFRGMAPVVPRRLVAVEGKVYVTLGVGELVTELDGATGRTLRAFAATANASEILVAGDCLVAAISDAGKERILALNLPDATTQWEAPTAVVPLSMTAAEGKVFAIDRESRNLCAWEMRTGRLLWREPLLPQQADNAFPFGAVVVAKDGVVLAGVDAGAGLKRGAKPGSGNTRVLWAFDAGSGRRLWEAPFGRGFCTSADIFVINGVVWHTPEDQIQDWKNPGISFNEGRDLKTGNVVAKLDTRGVFLLNLGVPHSRCHRHKASVNYLFTGRDGIETVDLKSGQVEINRWVRGVCQYGLMPANGLLYVPPHACCCYTAVKLNGFLAFSSAPVAPSQPPESRRVEGPGKRRSGKTAEPLEGQWPTYRGDTARGGHYRGSIAPRLQAVWKTTIGGELTPPICAGGKVFVSRKDASQVIALDARTGQELWRFTADAMVDSPPTYDAGGLLFGCRDGRVYRVRADDGVLEWTFLAARAVRWICHDGRVESAWPAHGSVLVVDGKVSVVAGINSFIGGGLCYYQLDAGSGNILQQSIILDEDPLQPFNKDRWELEGSLNDVLSGDGQGLFLRQREFEMNGTPKPKSRPHLFASAGFLDASMHNRYFWIYSDRYGSGFGATAQEARSKPSGRILCCDGQRLYGFRPKGFFGYQAATGGQDNDQLFGQPLAAADKTGKWSIPVPFSLDALIIADNALVVAGRNGNLRKSINAFEGKDGASLWVVEPQTGVKLSELALDEAPVFDGMAVADGRLYLATTDGQVRCYTGETK